MESTAHVTESTVSVSPPGDVDGSSGQINGPPGQPFNMEAAFLKMSGEMGQMTILLGRICEHLPITDARESYGRTEGRKQRHSASSVADSEDGSPNRRTSKDDLDAISVTASEDEVNNLLGLNITEPAEPGAAAVPNDELLTELSAVLTDEVKTGPKVTQQLADIVNKRWDNKLVPDKITKILEKYAQPRIARRLLSLVSTLEFGPAQMRAKGRPTFDWQTCNSLYKRQPLPRCSRQTNFWPSKMTQIVHHHISTR